MLQGILIDPFAKTVTQVALPPDGADYVRLIDAEWFDEVALRAPEPGDPGAVLYLDENGLTKPGQRFWRFMHKPDLIYGGKGLLVAIDTEGDACSGLNDPELIEGWVEWLNLRFAGFRHETHEDELMATIRVIPTFIENGEPS